LASEVALTASWLARSKEHHNYTYDLTPRNVEHLAWWVSFVTETPVLECSRWISEALSDEFLMTHVQRLTTASRRSGLADPQVRIARRAGWYAIVRAMRPAHVIETGTDKGLGSVVLAAALLRNEFGHLTTVDINPDAGYLVAGPYSEVTTCVTGDSIELLSHFDGDVGVFIHDSDHSAEHEYRELEAVKSKLAPSARILSDNSHATDSLVRWAMREDRRFLFFQERPAAHWYPGAGIGASW
jgi:predicted O-methyltransferase YrrM